MSFAKEPASRYQADQKVEIVLDPNNDNPGTVRINGTPIDNIAAIGVQTAGDDVDMAFVTLKIGVPASIFKLEIDQVGRP